MSQYKAVMCRSQKKKIYCNRSMNSAGRKFRPYLCKTPNFFEFHSQIPQAEIFYRPNSYYGYSILFVGTAGTEEYNSHTTRMFEFFSVLTAMPT
jgi:hypothetical protein